MHITHGDPALRLRELAARRPLAAARQIELLGLFARGVAAAVRLDERVYDGLIDFAAPAGRAVGGERGLVILDGGAFRDTRMVPLLPQPLRHVRRHLRRVTHVEMLHEARGDLRLTVVHGTGAEIHTEPVGEMLKQPDALGVHTGRRQIDDLRDAVLAVRARGLDVGEIHVRAHMHVERVGDAVHHLAHTEAAGARP